MATVGPSTLGLDEAVAIIDSVDDATEPGEDEGSTAADAATTAEESPAEDPRVGDAATREPADTDKPETDGETANAEQEPSGDLSKAEFNGYAPISAEPVDAAKDFVLSLGRPELALLESWSNEDDTVLLSTGSPSGPVTGNDADEAVVVPTTVVGRVDLAPQGDGYAVTNVNAELLDVEIVDINPWTEQQRRASIADSDAGQSAERVAGELSVAVEAGFAIDVVKADVVIDGVGVTSLRDAVDAGEAGKSLVSFGGSVPLPGSFRGWLVVTGLTADGVVAAVHAEPILYAGDPDPRSSTAVAPAAVGDQEGLVVRDGPGGEPVAVLDFGTNGIRRTVAVPETVGGVEWWSITTADVSGWARADSLMVVPDISPATLESWARSVLANEPVGATPLRDGGFPLFGDRLLLGDIGQPFEADDRFRGRTSLSDAGWAASGNLPEGVDVGTQSTTLADYYRIERWLSTVCSGRGRHR